MNGKAGRKGKRGIDISPRDVFVTFRLTICFGTTSIRSIDNYTPLRSVQFSPLFPSPFSSACLPCCSFPLFPLCDHVLFLSLLWTKLLIKITEYVVIALYGLPVG